MSNPIGWCDITINPITGCGNFGNKKICGDYCYAARMAKRLKGRFGYPSEDPFQPTFHPERIQEINWVRNKPTKIFLNSMSDWFSQGVNPEWIQLILGAVSRNKQDTFFVLTKCPEDMWILKGFGMESLELPRNLWWGVSVTKQSDAWRIQKLVDMLPRESHKFVSFEPLHSPIRADLSGIDWAIVGLESGNRKGKIWGRQSWIDELCRQADEAEIPIYLKNGLTDSRKGCRREEFPEGI